MTNGTIAAHGTVNHAASAPTTAGHHRTTSGAVRATVETRASITSIDTARCPERLRTSTAMPIVRARALATTAGTPSALPACHPVARPTSMATPSANADASPAYSHR